MKKINILHFYIDRILDIWENIYRGDEIMGRDKNIPIEVKIEAVCKGLSGNKILPIAKEYGITRQVIYIWMDRAKECLKEGLSYRKLGPKFKKTRLSEAEKKVLLLEKEIKKKVEILERKEEEIKLLEKKLEVDKENPPRPKECPKCNSKKIYKNGYTTISPKGLYDIIKDISEKIIKVPQYICGSCNAYIRTGGYNGIFF